MHTFKKALSIILCMLMLVGTVAVVASAATTVDFSVKVVDISGKQVDLGTLTIDADGYSGTSTKVLLPSEKKTGTSDAIITGNALGKAIYDFIKANEAKIAEKAGFAPYFADKSGTKTVIVAGVDDGLTYNNLSFVNASDAVKSLANTTTWSALNNGKNTIIIAPFYRVDVEFYSQGIASKPTAGAAAKYNSGIPALTGNYSKMTEETQNLYVLSSDITEDKDNNLTCKFYGTDVKKLLNNVVTGFNYKNGTKTPYQETGAYDVATYAFDTRVYNVSFADAATGGNEMTSTLSSNTGSGKNSSLKIDIDFKNIKKNEQGIGVISIYSKFEDKAYPVKITGLNMTSVNKFGVNSGNNGVVDLSEELFYQSSKNPDTAVKYKFKDLIADTTGSDISGKKVIKLDFNNTDVIANSNKITITLDVLQAVTGKTMDITCNNNSDYLEYIKYDVHLYALGKSGEYEDIKTIQITDETAKITIGALTGTFGIDLAADVNSIVPEGKNLAKTSSTDYLSATELPEVDATFESKYTGAPSGIALNADGVKALYFVYSSQDRFVYTIWSDGVISDAGNTVVSSKFGKFIFFHENTDEYKNLPFNLTEFGTSEKIVPSSEPDWEYATGKDSEVTYATRPVLDKDGNPVLDINGQPVTEKVLQNYQATDKKAGSADIPKPYRNCEFMGWKYFYTTDTRAIAEKAKTTAELEQYEWVEGFAPASAINEDGDVTAAVTHMAKAQWKDDRDFLFRIYAPVIDKDGNRTGENQIKLALGKDFKFYYWNNNKPCTKDEMQLNTNPDMATILFHKPVIETLEYADANGKVSKVKSLRFDTVMATYGNDLDMRWIINLVNNLNVVNLLKPLLADI